MIEQLSDGVKGKGNIEVDGYLTRVCQILLDTMPEVDNISNPKALLISELLSTSYLLDMIELDRPAAQVFSELNPSSTKSW